MPADPVIRPVQTPDWAQPLPHWQGCNALYGRAGTPALADEITRSIWARYFDGYEPVQAMVADRSGALVGLANDLFHRSTGKLLPSRYLQDLFPAEAMRGRGAGRALIEAVDTQARVGGATSVHWRTHETDGTAVRLYDQVAVKSGFIVQRRDLA
jgi:GNAT superfamily N-acetyltransferase